MILVDLSAVAFAAYYTLNVLDEKFYRHVVLNTLRSYNVKYRQKYGQMVICTDTGNYWRKEVFPPYKASRHTARENDEVDWKEVFRIMNVVRDEIREFMPWKMISVPRTESDDVIAALVEMTQEFGKTEPVMIISADGDFAQLQRHSNVSQFSPQTKKAVKDVTAGRNLREKILRGDSGDGIPNVLSGDTCFIDKVRQTPLSSKKLEHWISNWDTLQEHMDEKTYRNFQRNRRLIDFTQIPEDIRAAVVAKYEETPVPPKSRVYNYLVTRRCSNLISSASDFF